MDSKVLRILGQRILECQTILWMLRPNGYHGLDWSIHQTAAILRISKCADESLT